MTSYDGRVGTTIPPMVEPMRSATHLQVRTGGSFTQTAPDDLDFDTRMRSIGTFDAMADWRDANGNPPPEGNYLGWTDEAGELIVHRVR